MTSVGKWGLGVVALGLLAAGCSSSPAKASVSSSDVAACHAFGDTFIVHGSATTTAARLAVLTQMAAAQNANLRKEANALRAAITAGDSSGELAASGNIARTCYGLGLISKSGQPL